MALLGRQKALSGIFTKGFVGDRAVALGVKTIYNWADKRFLNGRLTSMGVSLGQTLNGQPLSINVTDGLLALTLTGIQTSTKGLIDMGANFGVTKAAEAFDIIDPPRVGGTGIGTNVTERRVREQLEREYKQKYGQNPPLNNMTSSGDYSVTSNLGGLNQ